MIIDDACYGEENLETSMLLERRAALDGAPKAETLAARMARPGLVSTWNKSRVDSASPILKEDYEVFICAVDNAETRRKLDGVRAGALVNAAVGGAVVDAGHALWSRHTPGDPPLSHLYPPGSGTTIPEPGEHVPAEFADKCSVVAYAGVTMAAPFVALASASLAVASCAQHALGTQAESRYVKVDLLGQQRMLDRRP